MNERMLLARNLSLGLLMLMVARGAFWLLEIHPEATRSTYALQIGTMVICAATAWITWKPTMRLQRKLDRLLSR